MGQRPAKCRAKTNCKRQRGAADDGQRGAAIVEFALVAVVLLTIIFGLIEGGLLVRARNAINQSVDEAVRRGAIAGSSASADWMILEQLEVRGVLSAARVNHVVVYRALASSDGPSEECRSGIAVSGQCNVYQRADFERPSADFSCADPGLDANWCPLTRAGDATSFEYVGVYIDATHIGLTGVFGDVRLVEQSALPLERSGS